MFYHEMILFQQPVQVCCQVQIIVNMKIIKFQRLIPLVFQSNISNKYQSIQHIKYLFTSLQCLCGTVTVLLLTRSDVEVR